MSALMEPQARAGRLPAKGRDGAIRWQGSREIGFQKKMKGSERRLSADTLRSIVARAISSRPKAPVFRDGERAVNCY